MAKKYRVIQWATGQVGTGALRGIIENPQLELVGLAVYSDSKNGVDAGELCGMPPTGIKATTDHEKLLAMEADCVSYNGVAFSGDPVVDEIEGILLSGKNVASSSILKPSKNNPGRHGDVDTIKRFEAACQKKGVTYHVSGLDPGFATDVLPLVLSGMCQHIESAHVTEIMDYSTFLNAHAIIQFMGFGKPIFTEPPKYVGEIWIPPLYELADGLGIEMDEIKVSCEGRPLERNVTVLGHGLKSGTLGALRFTVAGFVKGKRAVCIEHITRIDRAAAPDWPQPPGGEGGYIIEIGGKLKYKVSLEFTIDDGDFMKAACWATAMRLVNAIPAICEARPGVISMFELPLITGRGLFKVD